ncbi:MAG: tol-pal system protein YbgF [Sterolibacterium sp.]|nr:tol-pal system protein YbgF [Sterolibacterium sp.]
MRHGFGLQLLGAVALAVITVWPAHAGLFDDDEARNRIEKLRNELGEQGSRLENSVATTSRNQIELTNQIELIRAEVAKLRGQSEVLSYELGATQKRQNDFYVDLDNRLRKIEALAEAETKSAVADAKSTDPTAEMRDYEAALTLFKSAKYKDALAAFLGFIKTYASSGLLANAHYWAASSHFQLHDYAKAAELFAKIPATWPADAKAPDALLGLANSQQEAGDAKGMKKTLEQLIENYPASAAAQNAKQRLKKKK